MECTAAERGGPSCRACPNAGAENKLLRLRPSTLTHDGGSVSDPPPLGGRRMMSGALPGRCRV